jgi:hypothetical protein
MNFSTFKVGNPSAADTFLEKSIFLEKSSCNYVINNAFFGGRDTLDILCTELTKTI